MARFDSVWASGGRDARRACVGAVDLLILIVDQLNKEPTARSILKAFPGCSCGCQVGARPFALLDVSKEEALRATDQSMKSVDIFPKSFPANTLQCELAELVKRVGIAKFTMSTRPAELQGAIRIICWDIRARARGRVAAEATKV